MLHEYFCAPNGDGALVVRNEDEGANGQGWIRWSTCYITNQLQAQAKGGADAQGNHLLCDKASK
jgi:hypothetical protein